MIFKQWQQVLDGTKTQTRRLDRCPWEHNGVWMQESPCYASLDDDTISGVIVHTVSSLDDGYSRMKWEVGGTYAVQPGRGKTNLYLRDHLPSQWHSIHDTGMPELGSTISQAKQAYGNDWRQIMTSHPYCWYEARIRLTAIRHEYVQDITEADAIAEGAYVSMLPDSEPPIWQFAEVWNTIHTRRDTRWEDNPLVFVLEFELV